MDIESKHAAKLLEAIAQSNETLITLSQNLRERPEVLRVLHSLECRKSSDELVLEGYVDAELRNGKAVCWWLDVSWKGESWIIESFVLVNDSQGQHVLKEFPTKVPKTLDELINQLQSTISELSNSASTISLHSI